jgi:hypothetical protein
MRTRFLIPTLLGVLGAMLFFLFISRPAKLDKPPPAIHSVTNGEVQLAHSRKAATPDGVTNGVAVKDANVANSTVPSATGAHLIPSQPATPPAVLPPVDRDPSGIAPETVMENMRSVFRSFASRYGGNPVGTNPEITAALNGGNAGQTKFLKEEDGLRVNARGELIDSWGTPFFFHQLSGTQMEIHSAGPDRIMWTADDLVIK